MIDKLAWTVLALIHTLPALAFFVPALITRMYGVEQGTANFALMHHRAALFMVIVALCIWSAFRPEVRLLSAVCVGFSMVSFLGIWCLSGSPSSIRSIAIADIIGLPFLAAALWSALRTGI
jgi:hypothetical protein